MYSLHTFTSKNLSIYELKRPKIELNCFLYKHIEEVHMELFPSSNLLKKVQIFSIFKLLKPSCEVRF